MVIEHDTINIKFITKVWIRIIARFIFIHSGPSIIRMDKGTENVHVAAVQYALRSGHDDTFSGEKSFRYGDVIGSEKRALIAQINIVRYIGV